MARQYQDNKYRVITKEQAEANLVMGYMMTIQAALLLLNSQGLTLCHNDWHVDDNKVCCLMSTSFGVAELFNYHAAIVEPLQVMIACNDASNIWTELLAIDTRKEEEYISQEDRLHKMIARCQSFLF